jgi:hypothetical protein
LGDVETIRQTKEARDKLSDIVPSYMVPTVWTVVRDIPTLASAKLDRKQVTAWFETLDDATYRRILDAENSIESTIPASESAKKLQGIWAKVLNLPIGDVQLNKSWLGKCVNNCDIFVKLIYCM